MSNGILFRASPSVCSNSRGQRSHWIVHNSSCGADTIRISGSSTVYPITKAAIKDYQATRSGKAVGFELKESG